MKNSRIQIRPMVLNLCRYWLNWSGVVDDGMLQFQWNPMPKIMASTQHQSNKYFCVLVYVGKENRENLDELLALNGECTKEWTFHKWRRVWRRSGSPSRVSKISKVGAFPLSDGTTRVLFFYLFNFFALILSLIIVLGIAQMCMLSASQRLWTLCYGNFLLEPCKTQVTETQSLITSTKSQPVALLCLLFIWDLQPLVSLLLHSYKMAIPIFWCWNHKMLG